MDTLFSLLERDEVEPQGRCDQCKLAHGRTRPENVSLLRCPACDFPFGETFDAMRVVALSLQDPKRGDFVNVFSQPVCYIWLRVEREDGGLDLTVEPYLGDTFGTEPEWYYYEESNSSWSDIIGAGSHGSWKKDDFIGGWNTWAMQEGLCPGQEFLVQFKPPRWYRCSWEYIEYDVEYDFDIVMRAPRSPKQAARSWDQWKKACIRNRQSLREHQRREEYKRTHDIEAMYLRHQRTYQDDLDVYTVALCSKHINGGWLTQGTSPVRAYAHKASDPEPSWENALANLIEVIQKDLPHLDPEVVKKLPVR